MSDTTGPIAKLLGCGKAERDEEWPDYANGLGLAPVDAELLIAYVQTTALTVVEGDDDTGSVHLWRALAQLQTASAVTPLLTALASEVNADAEWFVSEFSTIMGTIGPDAVGPIRTFLAEPEENWFPQLIAVEGLLAIVNAHPETEPDVYGVIQGCLGRHERNPAGYNAAIVNSLIRGTTTLAFSDIVIEMLQAGSIDYTMVREKKIARLIG